MRLSGRRLGLSVQIGAGQSLNQEWLFLRSEADDVSRFHRSPPLKTSLSASRLHDGHELNRRLRQEARWYRNRRLRPFSSIPSRSMDSSLARIWTTGEVGSVDDGNSKLPRESCL